MIYIAEHTGCKDSVHNIEISGKYVTSEEYASFFDNFKFYYHFKQIKEIYDISVEELNDLLEFFSQDQLNKTLRTKGVKPFSVLQTGNKLLLNYCTSIRILVDKIELYLKQNRADKFEEFEDFCSNIYDNNFSYRFFIRLRNYIIHKGLPLTSVNAALYEDCNLYMGRDNLLEWDKWSTVKKDIEKMNENIKIQPYLQDIGSSIYVIYLQGLYYQAPEVISCIKKIEIFNRRHQVDNFDFVECDKLEDIINNKYKYHAVPWDQLLETINELNKHPKINIHIKDTDNKT